MQLDELYDYKNQMMEDLLTDECIVELIGDGISMIDAKKLMYKQVFPCEYVPDTVEDAKTFICCDVDVQRSSDKTFYSPIIYIWVFTHRSKMRAPGGGVLVDKICARIAKLLNGSRKYGLGELELYGLKRFAPMTDYQGKCVSFTAKDFNRLHNPNTEFPSNRKVNR